MGGGIVGMRVGVELGVAVVGTDVIVGVGVTACIVPRNAYTVPATAASMVAWMSSVGEACE